MEKHEPQRLQTLLNSLNGYSQMWRDPSSRFKVRDEYQKDSQGNAHLMQSRVSYIPEMLHHQYKNRVALRSRKYSPIDEHVMELACRFLTDESTRTCMLLYGTPGTGKTTLMLAMYDVISVLYKGGKETFSIKKASELGEMLKTDPHGFKRLKGCTALFIDDLAFSGEGELVNDYGTKKRPIEEIIETRYDRQLMTVCTSNLTAPELREKYGERIYSRMCEMYMFVPMNGSDYRQI